MVEVFSPPEMAWLSGCTPLAALKKQRFSLAAVAYAAGVSHQTTHNFRQQSELVLCSERTRENYCLVDAHMIALTARFARADRQNLRVYTKFIFEDLLLSKGVLTRAQERKEKARFCDDISAAPAIWSHRDLSVPWWIVSRILPMHFYDDAPALDDDEELFATQDTPELDGAEGLFKLNVTKILATVDARLVRFLVRAERERETAEKAPAE